MADNRNWEKELAKIDELIEKAPDEPAEAPSAPARSPTSVRQPGPAMPQGRLPAGVPAGVPAGREGVPAGASTAAPSRWARAGVWMLATIATAAAVALPFWPFGSRCGAELLVYMAAVGGTGLLGLATSVRSWRVRAPRAHVVGLLVLVWSLALASWQVLPRVGAALPTPDRPSVWSCG